MYIDSHNHLDFFEENIDKAMCEINEHKIITLANSMDIDSYIKNKEYAKKSKYIRPCFGIHPWKAAQYNGDLESLKDYIEESEIIGEIGLDYVWVEDKSTYEKQRKVFNYILEQGIMRNKVITIHTKGAEEEIYNVLKKFNYNKVIIHWYSGDMKVLKDMIDLGCYFSISVDVGYSQLTNDIIKVIPINKLLIETDGPTALEWVNGKYAYPSYIKEVYKCVAKYKGVSKEEIKSIVYRNFNKLIH